MCGIVGYIGNKNSTPILLNGLKKLEYRGYDSAGICLSCNNELVNVKKPGRIAELSKSSDLKNLNGNIGIAHTRWATHGQPNQTNAHPHLDCQGKIAIVHNGIIENYHTLKKFLLNEGHKIVSQTDSEIVAHLIEKFYQGDLEKATLEALNLIEGTYGLAVIHKDENRIIAARRGSPLIVGVGKSEMFVASDVTAILRHTKQIIYIEDNQIASITADKVVIKNLSGEKVDNKIDEIKWTVNQIAKNGYKHYMLKEIFEQSQSVSNTLRGRINGNKIKLTLKINPRQIDRIIIVACGTSWHSALIGKFLIEKITKIPVEVDYASEFRYRDPTISKKDLVVAISQSGETADTRAAIAEAKAKGANTIGIVNVVGSTISREVESGIYLHAGPEIGVASTKAFTCQTVALLLLALYLKQEKGESVDKRIISELLKLPEKIEEILKNTGDIKTLAKKFSKANDFLYLGRGINFPTALEGALKLKEISYIHAEGYPAAEMKHGPIALVDENLPVVFLATSSPILDKTLSNMQEVKARLGKIIAITDENEQKINNLTQDIIKVPKTIEEISPILNVIPLQLLAYYIADLRKINVDKPRNLAKSVTVE